MTFAEMEMDLQTEDSLWIDDDELFGEDIDLIVERLLEIIQQDAHASAEV